MKYFQITVQSGTQEELKKRVADNEKRGFEVVRYFETENEVIRSSQNVKYKSTDGTSKRYRIGFVNKRYGAVMRRDNRDRIAQ